MLWEIDPVKSRTLVVAITIIIYSRTNLPLRKKRKGDKKNIKNKAAKERPRGGTRSFDPVPKPYYYDLMQRYIINIKLQNLNFFLELTNIKKTVVTCLKICTFVVAIIIIIYSKTNLPLRKKRKGDKKNIKK